MLSRVKIKICGLTNYRDASLAVLLGADLLGFIFAESKRNVDRETVRLIINQLREEGLPSRVKCVGVFVNESAMIIDDIAAYCGLDLVQLHGDESLKMAENLTVNWYKALRVNDEKDLDGLTCWPCSRILVDAKVEGIYGGSGVAVPLSLAALASQRSVDLGKEFFLAGGITPHNVVDIILATKPFGIDVSSGVELEPGIKNEGKMRQLFTAVTSIKVDSYDKQ